MGGPQHRAAYPVDRAGRRGQRVDPVPEQQLHLAPLGGGAHPLLERREHARAGAPGDVEPGYGVAVPGGEVTPALGPADHREEADALRVQPGPLLAGREVDVRLRPSARPVVLGAVEAGAALPVLQRQLGGVLDPHPALLGGVDEEEAAEGPERLATH